MPGLEFPEVWAKIGRANKHLDDLVAAIATSQSRNQPPRGGESRRGERLDGGTRHAFRFTFAEPPNLTEWALVIGDVLSNLRGALDHLAWQLAEIGSGPTERTEFPIFKDRVKFHARKRNGEPAPGSGWEKIAGIPQPLQAAIEGLQPYNGGDAPEVHPLWVLHRACNEDKHRLPTPTVVLPHQADAEMQIEGADWVWTVFCNGPIEGDAIAFMVYTRPAVQSVRVKLELAYRITIEFAGVPGGPTGTLANLVVAVEHAVRYLTVKANEGVSHGPTRPSIEG